MENNQRFDLVLYGVSSRIAACLSKLSPCIKNEVQEVRMRLGQPVCLTVSGETVFVTNEGKTTFVLTSDFLKAEKKDLEESFRNLCQSSVYAHSNELKNGFIIMKNGCRAGVFGTQTENGIMRDVSSINIRIAHEIHGAANDLIKNYDNNGWLIAGPPGSGKTTVLRDMIRQLSNGIFGKIYRIAVIDSRGEISGSTDGRCINDLGVATDVLITDDKATGIEIALRTMFPDIIAFDEIGNTEELKRVSEGFCAGVKIITTAHVGSSQELMSREITRNLIESSAISKIAFLPNIPGGKIRIINVKELLCGVAC